MPEVPEEEWEEPIPDCRWRLSSSFTYVCRTCGASEKEIDSGAKKCPKKAAEAKAAAKKMSEVGWPYGGGGFPGV